MWRDWTTHKHHETKFLSEVLAETVGGVEISKLAAAALEKVRGRRLCGRFLRQFGEERLTRALGFLYAVIEGKIHLSEIEELRREKMFWGEIDEVEETMKEKIASLEVFVLVRELGRLESEHGFAHQFVKKEYRAVLDRLAEDFRLTIEDTEDVLHLILLHEKIIHAFSRDPNRSVYEYLVRHCQKYGRDTDDFLDLFLAAIFLVTVVEVDVGPKVFFNFLAAERLLAPDRNALRLQQRLEKKKKAEQKRFREVGLDGAGLMKLLNMKPGPEFGKILAAVQALARGEGQMPDGVPIEYRNKLMERIQKFCLKYF
jgi:hypothetical protein